MVYTIWRLSHFCFAFVSSGFLIIASLTGIILSFEPIQDRLSPEYLSNYEEIPLSEIIQNISSHCNEIIYLEKTNQGFLSGQIINKENKHETVYFNPISGKKIGLIKEKKKIFKFATHLHRSLFLKKNGRIIMGLSSLLLLLISITGSILIIKRTGSLMKFFGKIDKESFQQYYHSISGRFFMIPIVIISLSGCILTLHSFAIIDDDFLSLEHGYISEVSEIRKDSHDFNIFKKTSLSHFKRLEFPFSKQINDPYVLTTLYNEYQINQYTGVVFSQKRASISYLIIYWSNVFHTGKLHPTWSLIICATSISIIFFMLSGFQITYNRFYNKKRLRGRISSNTSEYIILVGSENGNTNMHAVEFQKKLLNKGYDVFLTDLNEYKKYPKAKEFIVFTSTFGKGEAPSNANKFISLFNTITQSQKSILYSIIGFGSTHYPDFCKFAIEVESVFKQNKNFIEKTPLCKINQQSKEQINEWLQNWMFEDDT